MQLNPRQYLVGFMSTPHIQQSIPVEVALFTPPAIQPCHRLVIKPCYRLVIQPCYGLVIKPCYGLVIKLCYGLVITPCYG